MWPVSCVFVMLTAMSEVLTKDIFLNGQLTARDAEVVSAEVLAGQREGAQGFRFRLEKGFLPTLGWIERLGGVLKPVVEKKLPVGLSCQKNQVKSLRSAGLHLIADIHAE
ncbi:MAG: hypothetical protein ACKOLA_01580 [Spartobacteria bacterium]